MEFEWDNFVNIFILIIIILVVLLIINNVLSSSDPRVSVLPVM